jgi:hypothetical protein
MEWIFEGADTMDQSTVDSSMPVANEPAAGGLLPPFNRTDTPL